MYQGRCLGLDQLRSRHGINSEPNPVAVAAFRTRREVFGGLNPSSYVHFVHW